MVRIRSDRWYSGENQKKIRGTSPSNSPGVRRVVSLVFMLALVIVLMQTVSKPKNVSNAFNALGIPLERTVVDSTPPIIAENTGHQTQPSSDSGDWQKTCKDLIPRVLDSATIDQIDQLATFAFASGTSRRVANQANNVDFEIQPTLQSLRATLDATTPTGQHWIGLMDRFADQWKQLALQVNSQQDSAQNDVPVLDTFFREQLQEYLDHRLLRNLRDAAPWSGGESVGFGRLLQRSDSGEPEQKKIPQVSTKQLDTEFPKWRGNWVRFRGTVRLVETVDKAQPLVEQSSYRVMWLRGDDLSSQPVAVYTLQSLAEKLAQELKQDRLPEIEVTALVGKKLAYASPSGVQVAPTLFSGSFVQFAYRESQSQSPSVATWTWRQTALGVTTAIVLGLLVVASLWKQTRRTKRTTIAVIGLFTLALSYGNCLAQQPPWSEKSSQTQQKQQFVEQQLAAQYTSSAVAQLEQTLQGGSEEAPEFVLRTLFNLKQIGWKSFWDTGQPLNLSEISRLQPRTIHGLVRGLQPLALTERQQHWFSVQPTKQIYKLQIQVVDHALVQNQTAEATNRSQSADHSEAQQLASVFCADVPSVWIQSAQLRQPIQLAGYSLVLTEEVNGKPNEAERCFIAEGASWRVDSQSPQQLDQLLPPLPKLWKELGSKGWDLAWFDLLAKNNKRALLSDESESLQTLLRITTNESQTMLENGVSPIEAIRDTADNIGKPLDWQVRLVNGTLVEFSSELSYYQFDGFVLLPKNQTIKFETGLNNGETVEFKDEFPITILSQSPHGLIENAVASAPGSWKIGRTASVQGRLYRLWSYESQRLKTPSGNGRLVAPLVMASHMQPIRIESKLNVSSGWLLYLLAMAIVVAVSSFVQIRFLKRPARRKTN